jgi:5'-deoxynucleotidase YfbR-like HD superfamily hydrolase
MKDFDKLPTTRLGDWMQTFSGKRFYPLDPRPEDIRLMDIAHALSHVCRFNGHTRFFYSVAQHSVLVSLMGPEDAAAARLLHDASEAYICDLPRPLKESLRRQNNFFYDSIEECVMDAVSKASGIEITKEMYKFADDAALVVEASELLAPEQLAEWWNFKTRLRTAGDLIKRIPPEVFAEYRPIILMKCLDPQDAKEMFLHRANQLGLDF